MQYISTEGIMIEASCKREAALLLRAVRLELVDLPEEMDLEVYDG